MTQSRPLSQSELKRLVARAALDYVESGAVLGVGTGSTVDQLIDQLPEIRDRIPACVSSSERSTKRLEALGFKVLDMNEVDSIGVYIDGADEIDGHFAMIKGGGGALTREKIVASISRRFVCIADASKKVDVLGRFPLRDPQGLETEINSWPGVVTVGLFAARGADVLLLGSSEGVKTFKRG